MNTDELREAALSTLRARLHDFATGGGGPDSIPADVREVLAIFPLDRDGASAAMNTEADQIRDGHGVECSATIREDDRANLFTNVAGWLLDHDVAGRGDPQIVDEAILDSYLAVILPGDQAAADEAAAQRLIITTVRGWSA